MAQKVRFAVALPPQQKTWSEYRAAALAADALPYETFWAWDHLLPIHGDMNGPAFECYTTLAALAEATKRIRIGALVSGVVYRNPAMQIKLATQIDVISNGRFDFGIGAAWAEREFRAFDIPFPEPKVRIGMLRETLELAKRLWTGDPRTKVTYEGKYVRASDLFINPQPVQRPHPPIVIGGGGEQLTLRVVAKYADVWHGNGDLATLERKMGLIDEYARGYGRDPSTITRATYVPLWLGDVPDHAVTTFASALRGTPEQARAEIISGDAGEIERRLRQYVDIGITYFVIRLGGVLDVGNWTRIAEQVIPRFANG